MSLGSQRVSRGVAAGAVLLALVSSAVPAAVHDPVSNASSVLLALAAVVAVRAYHRRKAWCLLASALGCWAAGDVLYPTGWVVLPGLLASDVVYLAGVGCLFAGVRRFVVERGARGLMSGVLDAATVGVAAAAIVWQLVVVDGAFEGPLVGQVVGVLYPLSDAMVLGLLAWLAFTPGVRARSTQLLAAFLGAVLVADVLWVALPEHLVLLSRLADPLYTVGYGLLVAAIVHPSAVDVSSSRFDGFGRVNPARVLFVTVAVVASPLASTLASGGSRSWPVPILAMLAAVLVAARVATLFRQNLRAEQALRDLAHLDPVTGLGNRAALGEVLEEALVRRLVARSSLFLLFIDLDRFKAVNDGFGHAVGDDLLRQVAGRLRLALPRAAAIARFGGDEFAVVLDGTDLEAAMDDARRVHAALTEPYLLGRAVVSVGASIGIAGSDEARPVAELVRDADTAMYQAKHGGGDPVQLCDLELRSVAARRKRIARGLSEAMGADGLSVVYQPIVRVAAPVGTEERVFGFEALARYCDPVLGPVSPLEFIAVAEESGLIADLGRRILDEACCTLAELNDGRAHPLEMWVNVSARQLEHEGVADEVASTLARHRLAPAQLALEITESTLMRDSATVGGALGRLLELGVTVALDDFGTGSSSLSYLNRLSFTSIKVDRSFVESMDADCPERSTVAGLLALARTIGCRSVVEGIETETQADALVAIGAELAQGYLFARPMARADALALAHGVGAESGVLTVAAGLV